MSRHRFSRIGQHSYWLSPDGSTDRPTLGAICGSRATLVVDAGASPAHAAVLLEEIERVGAPPPRFAALTHWHWDHVFGTDALQVPTLAHVETQRIVAAMAVLDWSDSALDERVAAGTEIAFCRDMMRLELPDRSGLVIRPPDIAFERSVEVDLGDVTCRLIHVGGDHAADSVVVYVPEDRIAFLGDAHYPAIYGGPRRYTLDALEPLLGQVLALDAECFLGGHDPEPISRATMEADARLMLGIGRIVKQTHADDAALREQLRVAFGPTLDHDEEDIADEFRAGIGLPPHERGLA